MRYPASEAITRVQHTKSNTSLRICPPHIPYSVEDFTRFLLKRYCYAKPTNRPLHRKVRSGREPEGAGKALNASGERPAHNISDPMRMKMKARIEIIADFEDPKKISTSLAKMKNENKLKECPSRHQRRISGCLWNILRNRIGCCRRLPIIIDETFRFDDIDRLHLREFLQNLEKVTAECLESSGEQFPITGDMRRHHARNQTPPI